MDYAVGNDDGMTETDLCLELNAQTRLPQCPSQIIYDTFIQRVYPALHTLYAIQFNTFDNIYWNHVQLLSAKSDSDLLRFWAVSGRLWPKHLDANCSCDECYGGIISCLQLLRLKKLKERLKDIKEVRCVH